MTQKPVLATCKYDNVQNRLSELMFFSACNCACAQYVVPVHGATLIPVAQLCQHTLSATCTVQAYLVTITIGLFSPSLSLVPS